MAKPIRLGRQTPTKSVTLPYENTYGQNAIDIYEKSGRIAQEWQKLLIYVMPVNNNDLLVHTIHISQHHLVLLIIVIFIFTIYNC